ncbi:hypothetical protein GCM10025879_03330 [Leuconostoc litchii]|uniref:bifunctional diaminohydroxyphosphoribosylaminopyrimidine deaminase/5-amino-6-(5-phosphoribosylamino)uracil reductase RibD n=1 Tax=Leuconostoc litchii TaxID=1981069 RepID=UPI0023E96312|nr:bifunctional diaminohydroxyphosphoribosylaminopyrimidine deaminase/5-amino-6-(5-phosphoribosylamino)uracil reductase RibD [Leuconostoc litchii]GMA69087.1 hypothetical protein GCM10025879_03330 [Leuconostoc litchii]
MNDLTWMRLAVREAARAMPYRTFENPRVGAVIVKNDEIIAKGYHEEFGKDHAEINAFKQVKNKSDLLGATLYVTLEPCSVKGKVGSCAEYIKNWGLKRVVVGNIDPNPSTNGKGIQILKSAGIVVDVLNSIESQALNPAFFYFFTRHMPYIQLKLALSKNGLVTGKLKKRSKLTDLQADIDIHKERGARSAIMIGSETFLTDKPMLTVRHINIRHQQPLKIIIDRRGRLQNKDFCFSTNWIIYTENEYFAKKHSYVKLMIDGLTGILADLGKQNIQSVMVEGGQL